MTTVERQNCVSRTPSAREYVRNCCVSMWDAIENAGFGMHDGAATACKNLYGAYDMKDMAFTAIDMNTSKSSSEQNISDLDVLSTRMSTLEMCFPEKKLTSFKTVFCNRAYYSDSWIDIFMLAIFPATTLVRVRSEDVEIPNSMLDDSNPNTVSIVSDATRQSLQLWLNGQFYKDLFYDGTNPFGQRTLQYGYPYHAIRLYGKPLSENELRANYTVDKMRFKQ